MGIGALAGLLVTAPLVAILYLANQLAGLPFVPFDIFEWLVRILPGSLLTHGIDMMVAVLMFLHLNVSDSAKAAEEGSALALFLICGVVAGLAFYGILRRRTAGTAGYWPGVILGLIAGLPATAMSLGAGQSATAHSLVSGVWVLCACLAWGLFLNWIYNRLAAPAAQESSEPLAVEKIQRRRFLVRIGEASAAVTVAGAGLAAVLGTRMHRGAGAGPPGPAGFGAAPRAAESAAEGIEPAPGTRPEVTPLEQHYRIDIDLMPPVIDGASWTLPITGLVDRPAVLRVSDFYNNTFGEPVSRYITLACISNPIGGNLIGTTRWTGVSLQRILDQVGVKSNARFLKITARDGFHETVALDLVRSDPRIMLAYMWDGRPLEHKHGYPLRIYIPDLYGMKQPKWITRLELIENDEPGYWVARGWDKEARMKATSVIDTVAVHSLIEKDGRKLVPIGGIAHAGARGISKVEVKVDDGPWTDAQLRKPLSGTTWVIWRYDWPFQAGNHTFSVRCYDGSGQAQIEAVNPPHPSGATGVHSVRKSI